MAFDTYLLDRALADRRGKRRADKRETIKRREQDLEMRRAVRSRGRR